MKQYKCDKCQKTISINKTTWTLKGKGSYGSIWDNEELHKHFCDNCLYNFIIV